MIDTVTDTSLAIQQSIVSHYEEQVVTKQLLGLKSTVAESLHNGLLVDPSETEPNGPVKDLGFIAGHDHDRASLGVLVEDHSVRIKQEDSVKEDSVVVAGPTQATSPIVRRTRRLRRIGEADSTPSGEGPTTTPSSSLIQDPTITTPNDKAPEESMMVKSNESSDNSVQNKPEYKSKYHFSDSEGEDDEEFDRQLDIDLDQLSAAVTRLRKLAEEMGRELEMQNQMLARLWTKADQQADKAVEGLWRGTSFQQQKTAKVLPKIK